MRLVICAFVLVLALAVTESHAASAIRFVGYNTTDCPISGGTVQFNATAEPQKCFSFTNLVNGQEPCVTFLVVREASNTPSFDVYNDALCNNFRQTLSFDSLCVNNIEGVPSTCSGAGAFQMEVVQGEECTTNCVEPAESAASNAVPADYSMLFAIVMGFTFMIGGSFL
jgi:hypothetical protein